MPQTWIRLTTQVSTDSNTGGRESFSARTSNALYNSGSQATLSSPKCKSSNWSGEKSVKRIAFHAEQLTGHGLFLGLVCNISK